MTRFVHQSDLFHPHGDPDDHWDLATVFALAALGNLDLRGLLLDYPPDHRAGDPATLAIAQLGYLTGVTGIPFAIGTDRPLGHRTETKSDLDGSSAAEWLCQTLQDSPEPITINIVGSCKDVAIAGLSRPDLFRSSCRAVYVNAGAARPGEAGVLEYLVLGPVRGLSEVLFFHISSATLILTDLAFNLVRYPRQRLSVALDDRRRLR